LAGGFGAYKGLLSYKSPVEDLDESMGALAGLVVRGLVLGCIGLP
jgi:hypothetical protein